MSYDTTLSSEVASREARLRQLELKAQADEKVIQLLKAQNEEQGRRLVQVQSEFAIRELALVQERDTALRRAQEVSGIIESLCRLGMDGLIRMRGDSLEAPADEGGGYPVPAEEAAPAAPLQLQEAPEVRARLPRPDLDDPDPHYLPRGTRARAVDDTMRRYEGVLGPVPIADEEPPPEFLSRPAAAAGSSRMPGFVPRRA